MTLYYFLEEENLTQIIPTPHLVFGSLFGSCQILAMIPFKGNRVSIKTKVNRSVFNSLDSLEN